MIDRKTLVALISIAFGCEIEAQQQPVRIVWHPEHPTQGSFIQLRIISDTSADGNPWNGVVSGSLAGQRLHFERDRRGSFHALAAVPVNARETLPLQLALTTGRDTTHRMIRIPIEPGGFSSERLSVSSQFSTPPDSALRARIREENARSRRVSLTAHDVPRLWYGEWVRPRPSRITSPFGTARVFNGEVRSRHMGVDLDGDYGDPIRAGNRGVVALVGDFYYSGNVVYIQHGAGLVTIYMHMSEVNVQEGETVERGQVIGKVGATGRVTGPHLHWVGRYGNISVDPLTLFDLDSSAFGQLLEQSVSR